MSNVLATNPIILDNSITSYKASVAPVLGSFIGAVTCVKLRWVASSAASQTLEIIDPQGGAQLAMLSSVSAGQDVELAFDVNPRLWRDFGVIIPSGKLCIFTK